MMRIVKEIKYWSQLFLIPIYGLSFLMPRSKKIWVMGSTFGTRFADNPKYFYLYLQQHQKNNIKSVWISKNKEVIRFLTDNSLEGYYLYSLKGIWYSLRAKIYLYDNYSKDICFTLSGGATKINMWHGIPLKRIQKDNMFDRIRNPKTRLEKTRWLLRRMTDEKPTDYVLTTSEFLKPIFSSAFHTEHVLVCGYPRNDILLSEEIRNVMNKNETSVAGHLEKMSKNNKIVFYVPTFRESEQNFFDIISLEHFQNFLEREQILFCVKLHPKSKVGEQFNKLSYHNIFVIDPLIDSYPILKQADVLITDYSSIYFDFLLTGKQIIFFAYDLKEYLQDSREMYFNYEEFTPGIKVYNQKDLEKVLLLDVPRTAQAEDLRQKVFDETSNGASEHLFTKILEL